MAQVMATGPLKERAARQMRHTAQMLDADHPETVAGDHLRDAARTIEHGQVDGAKRHLDAAMEVLTPRNLIRHGITDDEGHATAKHHMHQVHRHRLAVQDIEDTAGRNDRLRAMARAARGQPEAREPFPAQPPPQTVAAAGRPGKVTDLAAWENERRGRGGEWASGAIDSIMSHPQLTAMSPQDRSVVETHLKQARSASDHTTAEMHLTDARRRATKLGASDLAKAITAVHAYHRQAATAPAGIKPMMSQAAFNRFIAKQPKTADVKARVVPALKQQPFILATELAAWEHELRGKAGEWTGSKGSIFGKKVSKSEARGYAQLFGPLGKKQHAGGNTRHQAERAALAPSQRQVYDKLRARGRQHKFALQAAQAPVSDLAKSLTKAMAGMANDLPGIQLSARTAMLERTPAPRGRPGGPGLYDVSGMGHTAYLQQIVKALIEKRGMPPGKAYAVARGAIRKWERGGGHIHPEVQAAAGKAEAGELARQARAKASHGHANAWDVADALIELACEPPAVIELFNPNHAPTGRFTTAAGAGQGQGKAAGQGRSKAVQRAQLHKQIAGLRSRIAGLVAQLHSARRSKSSTPTKKGAGATSAKAAKAGKTASGKARSTRASYKTRSPSAIRAQIAILRAQLRADQAKLKALK
jgi:hypothetical protein